MARTGMYALQGITPGEVAAALFDVKVIDVYNDNGIAWKPAQVQQMGGGTGGALLLGYFSIGLAESYRPYFTTISIAALGPEDRNWPGSYAVAYWTAEWKAVATNYINNMINAGFDGVVFDMVDAFQAAWSKSNVPGGNAAQAMADLVKYLSDYAHAINPNFQIWANGGEDLLSNQTYFNAIDGMFFEELFYTSTGEKQSAASVQYRYNDVSSMLAAGKDVIDIEYVSNTVQVADVENRATEYGLSYYFTNLALSGIGFGGAPDGGGTPGGDPVPGGLGDEVLTGTPGNDTIDGGGGNDTVSGAGGNDVLHGGDGDDVLVGGAGKSVLYGDAGNDTLYGGSGSDTLYAGASGSGGWDSGDNDKTTDWLQAGSGGHQLLVGGRTAPDQTQVLWDPGTGPGNDTLDAGTDGGNHYMVGAGADTLLGGFGRDTLIGGSGDSFLTAGTGGNVLVSRSDSAHGSLLYDGPGNDVLQASLNGGRDTLYAASGNDTLYGGTGPGVLDASASNGGNWLQAGSGRGQSLIGGSGNDVLYDPASGRSTLNGGAGDDYIVGRGRDTLIGGSGNDTIIGSGSLNISGGAGDDSFVIQGLTGSDTISGGSDGEYNRIWFQNLHASDILSTGIVGTGGTIAFDTGLTVTFTNIRELFFADDAETMKLQ